MLKKLYLGFVNYFYLIELTAIHEVTQDTGENKKAEEWFTGMNHSLFFFFLGVARHAYCLLRFDKISLLSDCQIQFNFSVLLKKI